MSRDILLSLCLITVRSRLSFTSTEVSHPSTVDMPVCDGVEAAKQLRHLEEKRKAPVALPSE
jgi:hypothetical protein